MSAELQLHAEEPASVALQIAPRAPVEESLALDGDGAAVAELEVGGDRVHVVTVPAGSLTVTYEATVSRKARRATPASAVEAIRWRRQSRYCPSDRLERFVTTHLREQLASPHPAAAIGS